MILLRSDARCEYVCTADPAVDLKKANLKKYGDTLNRQYLPIKDGFVPTVFQLRRLTGEQLMHTRQQANKAKMAYELIAYGIERAENWDFPVKTEKSELGDRLTPESLDPFCRADELLYELANAVRTFSGIGPLDE